MDNFILFDKLVCGYKTGFRLQGISTRISKGSFTGIVGPNGSGKTTLFKAITGEIGIQSGLILLDKLDISQMTPRQKARKMAIVTQNTEIADISVEDYVLLGRMPYKKHFQLIDKAEDIEIAHKYMQLTGVMKYKDNLMNELSGGEQQLAAIARALTQEPDVLLLDEPTSFLDISHQVQILNLIQHLNESMSLTVLMIIHDLNLASEYCDYLLMMSNGSIYTEGTPEQVLNYQHIEDVYNTVVFTQQNPLSKKPAIFLVSDKIYKTAGKSL